ncbi:WD-40 repeat-containing protein [Reticulomyxa filosa]|uniref:WD-40 repeat-containing protein n=1 Tax=Reticulomyxa filosa TaxID=46433 RepID=X6NJ42_RETFI|nr:WD-40 repeat-containing protein [Reticulomyxa filosa]|eukprot:ETO26340.1 WD-40 repeat-containing protein [Reticulomyxa filosa]
MLVHLNWVDNTLIISRYFLPLNEYHGYFGGLINIKYLNDGPIGILSSADNIIQIWGIVFKHWKDISDCIYCAQFSQDDKMVISCSNDKTIRLWDTKSERELTRLQGHSWGVDASLDGSKALSTDSIRVKYLQHLNYFQPQMCSHFSSNGMQVIFGDLEYGIIVVDVECGNYVAKFINLLGNVTSTQFSPDGICVIFDLEYERTCILNLKR